MQADLLIAEQRGVVLSELPQAGLAALHPVGSQELRVGHITELWRSASGLRDLLGRCEAVVGDPRSELRPFLTAAPLVRLSAACRRARRALGETSFDDGPLDHFGQALEDLEADAAVLGHAMSRLLQVWSTSSDDIVLASASRMATRYDQLSNLHEVCKVFDEAGLYRHSIPSSLRDSLGTAIVRRCTRMFSLTDRRSRSPVR